MNTIRKEYLDLSKFHKCTLTPYDKLPTKLKSIISAAKKQLQKEKKDFPFGSVGNCHQTAHVLTNYCKDIETWEGVVLNLQGDQIHHSWNRYGNIFFDMTEAFNTLNVIILGVKIPIGVLDKHYKSNLGQDYKQKCVISSVLLPQFVKKDVKEIEV